MRVTAHRVRLIDCAAVEVDVRPPPTISIKLGEAQDIGDEVAGEDGHHGARQRSACVPCDEAIGAWGHEHAGHQAPGYSVCARRLSDELGTSQSTASGGSITSAEAVALARDRGEVGRAHEQAVAAAGGARKGEHV